METRMIDVKKFALALGAVSLVALPVAASAQPAPSYATQDEVIHGTIASIDGQYTVHVRDDRGFVDTVHLHDGTVINPTGLRLASGQTVTIHGRSNGPAFDANEIDTPYQEDGGGYAYGPDEGYAYPGDGAYATTYPDYPYYPYPAYAYGFAAPAFVSLGFGFGWGGYYGGGYYGGGYYGHGFGPYGYGGGYYGRGGYGYYNHGGYYGNGYGGYANGSARYPLGGAYGRGGYGGRTYGGGPRASYGGGYAHTTGAFRGGGGGGFHGGGGGGGARR